jgi:hypothetical protein
MGCPDCPPRSRKARIWLGVAIGAAVVVVLALDLRGQPAARPASPAARRGRVERVERPRFAAATAVRICPMMPPADDRVTCYGGTQPNVGTTYQLVDEEGVRATARARSVEVAAQDPCRLRGMHDVLLDVVSGKVPRWGQGYNTTLLGVQGVALEPGARVLTDPTLRSPSGRDGDQIWVAIDRDGDARVDLAVTYADCSAEVRDLPRAAGVGQKVTPYCMDYWLRETGIDWRRANRDIYFACW